MSANNVLQLLCYTKQYFKQDKGYVLSYLQHRSINDKYYYDLINYNDFGFLKNNTFCVDNELYSIVAFCTCALNCGYDIKNVNTNLGIDNDENIAIAGVRGDVVICLNILTGEIFLWLIESGNYEKKHIANSLQDFVEMIKYE